MKALFLLLTWFLICLSTIADTYYVNNKTGNDTNDGKSEGSPLATIARSTQIADTSDTIVLVNTGQPYREPLRLRKGGTPKNPLIIEGNGAIISGLKPLVSDKWEPAGDGLYCFKLEHPQSMLPFLVANGKKLPRAGKKETIKAGEFYWVRTDKELWFRVEEGKDIQNYQLKGTLIASCFAARNVSYVVCRNLVCEYASNDGFNIHGDCRGMYFENIEARHNGDDGFSIHESGGTVVRNGYFHHNVFGIQDVNAARSVYNGIVCTDNTTGVSFHGGVHSVVDCIISNNQTYGINIVGGYPAKHMTASQLNPLSKITTCFIMNAVVSGGIAAINICKSCHVTIENSILQKAKTGIMVEQDTFVHLTASIITECTDLEINSASSRFFCDYNIYDPGRFKINSTMYSPKDWTTFRKAVNCDGHSEILKPVFDKNGRVKLLENHSQAKFFKGIKFKHNHSR